MRRSRQRRRGQPTQRQTRRWPLWLIAAGFTGFVASSLFEWSDAVAAVFGGMTFVGVVIAATLASRRSSDGEWSTSTVWSDTGDSGGSDGGGNGGGDG